MKFLKYIFGLCLSGLLILSCTEDDNLDDLDNIVAPSNIAALVQIAQDNTGLVTITPNGEGVVSFDISFGDDTMEPENIKLGESITHVYTEGTYNLILIGNGITGLKTETVQEVVVSFNPPENLVVTIENDAAVSKQVNVTATADNAMSFDVYFGETGNDTPVTANIGETAFYTYQEAGTYTIRVVAKGGAIATTEYTEEFLVTEILQPIVSAPIPPARAAQDVVSMFSDAYTDVPVDTWRTPWSDAIFEDVDIDGNPTKKYSTLNFVGIEATTTTINASAMTHFHVDFWSPNLTEFRVKLVDFGANGIFDGGDDVEHEITVSNPANGEWVSLDIPLSDFTGLTTRANIAQLIYVGVPSGTSIAFIDNIYFHRPATEAIAFPINFESSNLTYTWSGFGTSDFGAIPAAVAINPDQSGINNSNAVVEIQKTPGAQVWAGASLPLSGAADFSNGTTVTMKVWSPRAGVPVLFKMEDTTSPLDGNGNPTVFVEVQATTTVANTWEELSFDLTSFGTFSTSISYFNIIIFPDFGNGGTGEAFYFDDIEIASVKLPLNFEVSTLNYIWTGFGTSDFGPIPAATITNSNQSGINLSNTVVEIQKPIDAQVWAGASMPLDGFVDFSNGTTVKIKVWSPRAGVPILLKMEDTTSPPDGNGNPTVFVEVQATTTVANTWEELSFDLTSFGSFSTSISYYNVIIFPDFGSAGTGEVFYFDDIILTN